MADKKNQNNQMHHPPREKKKGNQPFYPTSRTHPKSDIKQKPQPTPVHHHTHLPLNASSGNTNSSTPPRPTPPRPTPPTPPPPTPPPSGRHPGSASGPGPSPAASASASASSALARAILAGTAPRRGASWRRAIFMGRVGLVWWVVGGGWGWEEMGWGGVEVAELGGGGGVGCTWAGRGWRLVVMGLVGYRVSA